MLQFKPVAVSDPDGLPALVDRAARALSNARSSAEVLEARDTASLAYDMAKKAARMAQAKGAHDTLIAAAHRVQGDALIIEGRAKQRLADEIDAAQEAGELAKRGRPKKSVEPTDLPPATQEDVGISENDVKDARRVRDAEEREPGIVERTVKAALDRGEEPTRAAVNKAIDPYIAKKAQNDSARTDQILDQQGFKALRKLWKSSRPGARALFREFIKGEK